jgi:hypothetical protein
MENLHRFECKVSNSNMDFFCSETIFIHLVKLAQKTKTKLIHRLVTNTEEKALIPWIHSIEC